MKQEESFTMKNIKLGQYLEIEGEDKCPGNNCRKSKTLKLKRIKYEFECGCGTTCNITID